jgi:CIC family chloride channel protein
VIHPRIGLSWARNALDIFSDRRLGRRGRWILLSTLIGTVSGLGAILFDLVFRLARSLLLEGIGQFQPPASAIEGGSGFGPESIWLLPLALVIGGLITGALVFGLAPEAEGHGTDAVIRSFHQQLGKIRRRVPTVKALSSAITIGSGGSAGREGPIAQIGAGFGSFLGDLLKLTNHDRRILMMAGVAGGIGSIFRAPLGAALFSAEVLYSKPEFEYEVLLPSLISSITGYTIYSYYAGFGFLFDVPAISFSEPEQLPVFALLAIVCALAGALWPRIFYGVRDRLFAPLRIPRWLKPAIGALLLGGIALVFPECLGMGYGYIQEAIDGAHTIRFLLLLAGLKIVATSLTISSGGSGGVFGPSLVIGGALGAAFGQLVVMSPLAAIAPDPVACIMVGMGGFFAGVAKTPFASVFMVMEMTGSYGLLVPSLAVATIAYLLLPLAVRLYEHQVPSRLDSPAHTGSFAVDALRRMRVREIWPEEPPGIHTVRDDTSFDELVELAERVQQNVFPVVDQADRLVGELSIEDIRRALVLEEEQRPATARDCMRSVVGPLAPDDNLATAARLLATRISDSVTIVDSHTNLKVIGSLTRRELILSYGKQMDQLRDADQMDSIGSSEPF